MFPLRNGSLPANALLLAIGAAAGVGMTVLVGPLISDRRDPSEASGSHRQASNRTAGKSRNTATALREAGETTDPQERTQSFRNAGASAAEKDPAQALLLAANISSEQDKLDFLRGIYSVWSTSDPTAALEYAKSSMPAGLARSEVIGIAVNKWASQNPRAAWMWTEENLSGPLQEQAMSDVLISWTRKTPEAAAQWFVSTGHTSQALVSAVAGTYAEQKPADAYHWANSFPDPNAKRLATDVIVPKWIEQNPLEAIAVITPDLGKPQSADLPTVIPDIWGTTDPAATSDWIKSLPDGPAKNEAAATLATVWASSDIQGAITWSDSIADETMRHQVITHIGTTWGAIDPDSALNWLESLPAATAADGIIGAFNSWAGTDAEGLRQVIDTSPLSPEMDQARLALGDVLAATDPGASLDLASQITTDASRDAATARYFRQFRKMDDASAQAWLTQNWSALPPSTQIRLTQEQRRNIVAR